MEYIKIVKIPNIENDKKLFGNYCSFEKLVAELEKKEIPVEINNFINHEIEATNSFSGSAIEQSKRIKKAQSVIIKRLEKDLKLVPKNYYRSIWLPLGMSAFGVPIGLGIGLGIGLSLGNLAFLGIGLPIGMGIGVAVGTAMDKKAMNTGKQLDFEMKY